MRARVGPAPLERRDHVEAVAVAEPHVDHGEGGRGGFELHQPLGDRFGGSDREAAALHRAGEPLQERLVVLDDQQRTVRWDRACGPSSTIVISVSSAPAAVPLLVPVKRMAAGNETVIIVYISLYSS